MAACDFSHNENLLEELREEKEIIKHDEREVFDQFVSLFGCEECGKLSFGFCACDLCLQHNDSSQIAPAKLFNIICHKCIIGEALPEEDEYPLSDNEKEQVRTILMNIIRAVAQTPVPDEKKQLCLLLFKYIKMFMNSINTPYFTNVRKVIIEKILEFMIFNEIGFISANSVFFSDVLEKIQPTALDCRCDDDDRECFACLEKIDIIL
jgi:hypothetical protein